MAREGTETLPLVSDLVSGGEVWGDSTWGLWGEAWRGPRTGRLEEREWFLDTESWWLAKCGLGGVQGPHLMKRQGVEGADRKSKDSNSRLWSRFYLRRISRLLWGLWEVGGRGMGSGGGSCNTGIQRKGFSVLRSIVKEGLKAHSFKYL